MIFKLVHQNFSFIVDVYFIVDVLWFKIQKDGITPTWIGTPVDEATTGTRGKTRPPVKFLRLLVCSHCKKSHANSTLNARETRHGWVNASHNPSQRRTQLWISRLQKGEGRGEEEGRAGGVTWHEIINLSVVVPLCIGPWEETNRAQLIPNRSFLSFKSWEQFATPLV